MLVWGCYWGAAGAALSVVVFISTARADKTVTHQSIDLEHHSPGPGRRYRAAID